MQATWPRVLMGSRMDETRVIQKLIEHDQRFDQLVTKDDFATFRNEVSSTQDEMLKILRRLERDLL